MPTADNRLDTLLADAARIFAERGFHGTSMRDLSRASGLSLSGIYHYVESKHELLFLIQERCFAEVIRGAREAVAQEADPEARLGAFVRHHVGFFTGHMPEMKVLSHEAEELTGIMATAIRARKREYVAFLTELLEQVDVPNVSPHIAAYALFGMMNWIYTWYRPGGDIPPAHLADEIARLFLDGYLQPESHAARPLAASHGG
ncbi:MAG TPA: TetR/AcrR family transcriptional regulator [Gemmatimonadales bacterium]|nr:TetR/AcrR family transcriptional regulator [Gemmatimonadales bacterium]